jgi:hypothetical protein
VYPFPLLALISFLISIFIQKLRALSTQNSGEERGFLWNINYLRKTFEEGLKAGRLLSLLCAFKRTLHKGKLILFCWCSSLVIALDQTASPATQAL